MPWWNRPKAEEKTKVADTESDDDDDDDVEMPPSSSSRSGSRASGLTASAVGLLTACTTANVKSASDFESLNRRAQQGDKALAAAREDCKKAAIAHYGPGQPILEQVNKGIDAQDNLDILQADAARYWATAPGASHRGKRQTRPSASTILAQMDNPGKSAGATALAGDDLDAEFDAAAKTVSARINVRQGGK